MRKLVYILLNMFIQLMSLPFLAFTIMLIVYGMFGIGHYSPFLIFSIVLVILLTTIAFGFYIHILISSYNLIKLYILNKQAINNTSRIHPKKFFNFLNSYVYNPTFRLYICRIRRLTWLTSFIYLANAIWFCYI